MTPAEMTAEMLRLSKQIDQAIESLIGYANDYAQTEHDYRMAKANAWVTYATGTVAERQAYVDAATADERRRRDLADAMKQVGLEALRSRRSQLSALQSLMNAHRAEAEYVRTAP